ncbi:MAG TPA: chloride channel protein [Bacteroidota bacterium]|nr:chloride channel protein [Bacteroidota bacterium]
MLHYYKRIVEFFNKVRLLIVEGLLKLNLSQDILFLFIASLVGIASGYGAVLFHEAIRIVQQLLFVSLHGLYSGWEWSWLVVMFYPALGGLLVGIVTLYASPETKGHGVPEVIKAVIARGGYMKSSLVFTKTITSALSIGSGGGAGREGPIVQIGASVGSAVGQFFKLSSEQLRTLVACGAAGGIAAIFNAPLGGVMFALEIIIGEFSVRTFSPIVVSAVLATAVSRSILGDHPTFVATNYALVSNYELAFYLALGMMTGVVAVWFTRTMFWIEDWFKTAKRIPRVFLPAFGGLGVGLILIWLPFIAGFSYDINNQAILGQANVLVLIAVFLLKPVSVGLTLGSGGSGGVFAPALKAGGAFGGVVGFILHWLFPEETASSGAYALVGMGAMVAGTMHAPLTAIIMVFEISDTYQVILPIMFAAVSSAVVSRIFMKQSIYTYPLEKEGIEIGYGINLSIVHRVNVATLVRKKFVKFEKTTPLEELMKAVEEKDQTVFPVVSEKDVFLGLIRFQDLWPVYRDPSAHNHVTAEDIMVKNVPSLTEQDTLDRVLKTFELIDIDALPVVSDHRSKRLIGIVRHEDALRRYRKEILLRSEK